MRKYGRIDRNQVSVIRELRKAGCTVTVSSYLGDGFPDAVVGLGGVNYLIEIKDPDQPPSKRKLTADEKDFHASWNGQVCVIETADDFLRKIQVTR
jgi:hypothetical protein